MKIKQHCGICAYTKIFLENSILEELREKEKMNDLKKLALADKAHYKVRAYEKVLDEIKYMERKLK